MSTLHIISGDLEIITSNFTAKETGGMSHLHGPPRESMKEQGWGTRFFLNLKENILFQKPYHTVLKFGFSSCKM